MVTRCYKFLLKPSPEQRKKLNEQLLACNKVKTLFIEDYNKEKHLSKMLKEYMYSYIAKYPELGSYDRSALMNTLFKLNDALEAGSKVDPKRKQTTYISACLKNSYYSPHIVSDNSIFLPHIGEVKTVMYRKIPQDASLIQFLVTKEIDKNYFVCIVFRINKNFDNKVLNINNSIGIDYSSKYFIVDSNGLKLRPPKAYTRSQEKLAILQQELRYCKTNLSRKKKKTQISKLHVKIKNQRTDFLHKVSTYYAEKYDYVFIEDLNMNEMAQGFVPTSTYDNAFGRFMKSLMYKTEEQGKKTIKINKWFPSSQKCHNCGYQYKGLSLDMRTWTCPECGMIHDRDVNAAINIKEEGIRTVKMM